MSNTRIYLVAACIGGQTQAPRLIDAGTASAARNHATKDWIAIKPATPKEVAQLIAAGVKLETATEAPPEQKELPGTGGDAGTSQVDGSAGDGTAGSGGTGTTDADAASNEGAAQADEDALAAAGTTRRIRRR